MLGPFLAERCRSGEQSQSPGTLRWGLWSADLFESCSVPRVVLGPSSKCFLSTQVLANERFAAAFFLTTH